MTSKKISLVTYSNLLKINDTLEKSEDYGFG